MHVITPFLHCDRSEVRILAINLAAALSNSPRIRSDGSTAAAMSLGPDCGAHSH